MTRRGVPGEAGPSATPGTSSLAGSASRSRSFNAGPSLDRTPSRAGSHPPWRAWTGQRQLTLWEAILPPEPSGQLLARARIAARLTQARLAEAIGVHQSSISRLERGDRVASFDELERIAAVLGISVAQMLGDSPAGVRRHARGGAHPRVSASVQLASRLTRPNVLKEFLARGGSARAVALARAGRQPLSARQASLALSVLGELEADAAAS